LDDPSDFVRLELEAAFRGHVHVIPVLVDGASIPKASDLPESIQSLVTRNALRISHEYFVHDADQLITAIRREIPARDPVWRPPEPPRKLKKGPGLAGILLGPMPLRSWLLIGGVFGICLVGLIGVLTFDARVSSDVDDLGFTIMNNVTANGSLLLINWKTITTATARECEQSALYGYKGFTFDTEAKKCYRFDRLENDENQYPNFVPKENFISGVREKR
jgi:hypothetical protein